MNYLFDDASPAATPAGTEAVKLGAKRIRDLKDALQALLSQLFNNDSTLKTGVIPTTALSGTLTSAQLGVKQVKDANIDDATIPERAYISGSVSTRVYADNSVTPGKIVPAPHEYAIATFSAGTYSATFSPVPVLADGITFRFQASTQNTGATSFNPNAIGALAIVKNVTQALDPGDITAGQVVEVVYNLANNNYQMIAAPITPVLAVKVAVRFDLAQFKAVSISSTVTANVITTASAHGLTNGTTLYNVPVAQIGGNPTAPVAVNNTSYFIHVVAANQVTLHTTAQDAITGANPVAISGNFTGTAYKLFYILPDKNSGGWVSPLMLWDGSTQTRLSGAKIIYATAFSGANAYAYFLSYDGTTNVGSGATGVHQSTTDATTMQFVQNSTNNSNNVTNSVVTTSSYTSTLAGVIHAILV